MPRLFPASDLERSAVGAQPAGEHAMVKNAHDAKQMNRLTAPGSGTKPRPRPESGTESESEASPSHDQPLPSEPAQQLRFFCGEFVLGEDAFFFEFAEFGEGLQHSGLGMVVSSLRGFSGFGWGGRSRKRQFR